MSMIADDLVSGRHQTREEMLGLLERPDPEDDPEGAAAYDRARWEADFHAQAGRAPAELPSEADPFAARPR